jgi:beta-phosphoglucomutase-like phosphatase (HAD superfamily)
MLWDPIALSAAAARMVVAAAFTDPSEAAEAARQEVPQLLGRGDRERELLVGLQLDQTRDQLQATAGLEQEQARAVLEAVWRAQLADLLEEHGAETAHDLRQLVDQLERKLHCAMVEAGGKARTRKQWRDALRPLPGVVDWYKVNAFAGILLAAGFVVLKCYVIARGDLTTALGILQYVGLATVVTASLLSSLPILTAAMLASAISQMTSSLLPEVVSASRIKKPKPPPFTWRLVAAMLGALVLAAVFSPWTYLLAAALVGVGIGVTRALGAPSRRTAVGWLAALVALPFVIVNLSAVWLPHEIVTFRPSTHLLPQVGYVLSEDNGWITILITGRLHEHTIIRVLDATVKTQTVCEREPGFSIFNSHTLWRVVTKDSPNLGPSPNTTCPAN